MYKIKIYLVMEVFLWKSNVQLKFVVYNIFC